MSWLQKQTTTFVVFLLAIASVFIFFLLPPTAADVTLNRTFRSGRELSWLTSTLRAYLRRINKPAVKTIRSSDGDIIDCVPSHLQPSFDHCELQGQIPLDPPERLKSRDSMDAISESFQIWTQSGESCPEGTIPIRRTTESDILRGSSIRNFGKKTMRSVRRDSSGKGHEHAVLVVNGDQYYGAKATINVWAPIVADQKEFSLSQIWLIAGSFGSDLNTIEAGWQVSPELYGDNNPRFFTYWTSDAYQATGCYNLLCSGFIQTNNKIAIGAAISPISSYNGKQFDISLMIWKDPKHGNWWLELGPGLLVGYWPETLFSHLKSHAGMVQFGGEIFNSRTTGFHTSTQMGSGHFAEEGYGKASYFRNLGVVDWDNNVIPVTNRHLLADHSGCYDVREGQSNGWGTYFYYGGPVRIGSNLWWGKKALNPSSANLDLRLKNQNLETFGYYHERRKKNSWKLNQTPDYLAFVSAISGCHPKLPKLLRAEEGGDIPLSNLFLDNAHQLPLV